MAHAFKSASGGRCLQGSHRAGAVCPARDQTVHGICAPFITGATLPPHLVRKYRTQDAIETSKSEKQGKKSTSNNGLFFLIRPQQRTHMSSMTTAHSWKSSRDGRITEASSLVKQLSLRRTMVGKKRHSVWSLLALAWGMRGGMGFELWPREYRRWAVWTFKLMLHFTHTMVSQQLV